VVELETNSLIYKTNLQRSGVGNDGRRAIRTKRIKIKILFVPYSQKKTKQKESGQKELI
jgi:hypothetical protein